MEEKEYNNQYAIPANYTDSGKLFGGMLEVRNTIEAIFILTVVGYPELTWLPLNGVMKVVVMTVTLLPLGIIALMGIAGDSLLQYVGHIVRYWARRRKLHFRRIGYRYGKGKKGAASRKNADKQKRRGKAESGQE